VKKPKSLSHKTASRNFNSIHKIKVNYEKTYEGETFSKTHNCGVEVIKSGKTSYEFQEVPISIVHYSNYADSRSGSDWYRFNIYWDDAGASNYTDMGLFGYYDTDYSNTVIKDNDIYITSSNGKKLVIRLPKKVRALIGSK
jgi:hypothetical protein